MSEKARLPPASFPALGFPLAFGQRVGQWVREDPPARETAGVSLIHTGLDTSSLPSSVCEAAVSRHLLKVEAISERCRLLSALVSCPPQFESHGCCIAGLGRLRRYLASVAFHIRAQ